MSQSVTVNIGVTSADKRALTKNFSSTVSLTGALKNETNVVNPSILCKCSAATIARCNYMTIPAFGRKYFITDITAVSDDLCMVSGHCDVLSTYASEIKANQALVGRSQSNWNVYLNDPRVKTSNRMQTQLYKFPNGFGKKSTLIGVFTG